MEFFRNLLERIARDSKDDHWTIMEVLTAFVREKAPAPQGDDAEESAGGEKKGEERLRPPTDIQAILTVIGRRKLEHEEGEDRRLDLSETDLRGAILVGARLVGAILRDARLEGASLMGARLEGANLMGARLEGAYLVGASLEGANLMYARLEGANLGSACLEGANLWHARLEGADLLWANLVGAYLKEAHLGKVDLRPAINLSREQVESAHCYTKEALPEDLRNLADLEDRPHEDDGSHQTETEAWVADLPLVVHVSMGGRGAGGEGGGGAGVPPEPAL